MIKSPHILNLPLVLISIRSVPAPRPTRLLPVFLSITISTSAVGRISNSKFSSNPLIDSKSRFTFTFLSPFSIKVINESSPTLSLSLSGILKDVPSSVFAFTLMAISSKAPLIVAVPFIKAVP